MLEYDSNATIASTRSTYGHKHKRAKEIIAAVDDFAHSSRGEAAIQNVLLCGSADGDEGETFRQECERHVRRSVFGSGLLSMIAWMAVRWLVIAIIEHYLKQILETRE